MSLQSGDVLRGSVKRFNSKRGFGFVQITGESTSEEDDVFVHQSDIDMEGFRSLNVGEDVEFTLEITAENMLKAKSVKLISVRVPSAPSSHHTSYQSPRGAGGPLVDAGQRALVRTERLERQMKKLIEILTRDNDGVVLESQDVQEIYTA
jgi:CspA family cold shock protein